MEGSVKGKRQTRRWEGGLYTLGGNRTYLNFPNKNKNAVSSPFILLVKFAKEGILTAITSYSCLLLLRLPFCHGAPISYLGSNLHARPHHQSRFLKSNVQGYVRTIHAFSLPLCYARWNTWVFPQRAKQAKS